jgi:HEAT repeat protein
MISRQSIPLLAALALPGPAAAQVAVDAPIVTVSDPSPRVVTSVVTSWADQDRDADRGRAQADRERAQKEREMDRARSERDREDSLYEQGTNALWENRWDRALTYFTRLSDMKSRRADAALYWKSYAQNRLGQRAESLATIAELIKGYPGSTYLKQAKALELEVRNAAGQPARPEAQGDEDLKLIAINALAHSNAQEAVPLLENVLNGTGTPRLKSQALFVLAQINNARAREVLKSVAKGSSIPELQGRAIQYLGVHGGPESRATLAEIYGSTSDIDLKRRILRAFMVAGEKDRLFNAAQTETSPELRLEAVRQLGAMGANDYLWQMYQKETSVDVKRQIINALQVGGNTTRMLELAKTEKDPELRRAAIRNLGIMGPRGVGDTLAELYPNEKDPAIRRTIVNALFTQNNAAALVTLARKETDIDMKKEMVQKLSTMDNPTARNYMIELLK